MSSMEEGAGSPGIEPPSRPHSSSDDPLGLTNLLTTLTGLLAAIDDDPRLMDANVKEAHRLVEDIRAIIKKKVFGPGGPLSPYAYEDTLKDFDDARSEEYVMHEVYIGDLERYTKRRAEDLGVDKLDSDTLALARRRGVYIGTLCAFRDQAAAIREHLQEILTRQEQVRSPESDP